MINKLEWSYLSDGSGKQATGLKYYYYIYFSEQCRLVVCQKWQKSRNNNIITHGDKFELEDIANEHNFKEIQKEIDYHEKQLKVVRKTWITEEK